MKIGIFVGCFNPAHNVHVEIAKTVIEKKLVDKVVFVPAGDEYKKQGLALGKDRIKMLELALENEKNCSVSSVEVEHKKLFTIETLEIFESEKQADDEMFLIIGSDNLKDIHSWHRADELIKKYKILVMFRNDMSAEDFPEYAGMKNIIFVEFNKPVAAINIRNALKNGEIELAKTMMCPKVFDYISGHALYEIGEKS